MKKYVLSIGAIFKNEGPYLREWIEYHRMVGVEHFYLYNNDSTDNYQQSIGDYVNNGIVSLFNIPGEKVQTQAYNHCLKIAKEESIWLAIIDLDEFIIPKDKTTIPETINEILGRANERMSIMDGFSLSMVAGVQLCWVYYGTSFHIDPPNGLVLENYLNRIRLEDNDNWCKCIYYTDHIDTIINPHFTIPKDGKIFIDENSDYVPICARSMTTKAKHLYVNHYTSRSYNEHVYKLTQRGWADGLQITQERVEKLLDQGQYQFNEVYDPTTLRYVPALKNRLGL